MKNAISLYSYIPHRASLVLTHDRTRSTIVCRVCATTRMSWRWSTRAHRSWQAGRRRDGTRGSDTTTADHRTAQGASVGGRGALAGSRDFATAGRIAPHARPSLGGGARRAAGDRASAVSRLWVRVCGAHADDQAQSLSPVQVGTSRSAGLYDSRAKDGSVCVVSGGPRGDHAMALPDNEPSHMPSRGRAPWLWRVVRPGARLAP